MTSTKHSRRWKQTVMAGAVAVALAGGYTLNMTDAAAIAKPVEATGPAWQAGPPSFSALVERVKPAVVNIAITGKTKAVAEFQGHDFRMPELPENGPFGDFFKHFFDGNPGMEGDAEQKLQAVGSGFIISADGLVVTNYHVIEHADEIEVIMQNGNRHRATVQGRDAKTDLALLQVKSDKPLPFVELGDSDKAKVGEWVVAVGNPFGLGGSVTAGIISARGRDIQSGPFDDFLQVDAPINRGNSGGPLFDTQGKVVGINTAIYSPSGGNVGIGFAIPSNMAKDIIAQLKVNGSVARGWLGVQIQPVTEEIAENLGLKQDHGALVASVVNDSPAAKAGIKPGDVILKVDGYELQDFKDLPKRVANTKAGSETRFDIHRKGKTRKIDVEIGRMPSEEVEVALANTNAESDSGKLGIYLTELTPEARQRHGIAKDTEGVLVAEVKRGSPAAKAGIRNGSVISMVGQESVRSPDEVIAKVKQAAKQKKSSVLMLVEHKGSQRFVAVKFATA